MDPIPQERSIDRAIDGPRAHLRGAHAVMPSAHEPCWSGRGHAPAAAAITALMRAEPAAMSPSRHRSEIAAAMQVSIHGQAGNTPARGLDASIRTLVDN
ncbi:hypothetical protein [Rhodococcus sp. 1168]|uniref:hypothetical protein n=1 Tax=Rhodococcus sp. 1168 TaxID=2018041 RepID=UPI000A09E92C|nr:hypothetical protein [Rhodococcus sp. 1168]ORI24399.1 hypothetical protein BJI47_09650 [Rhodococcus sp. 1168]